MFTYVWFIFMVNVCKYTIVLAIRRGVYLGSGKLKIFLQTAFPQLFTTNSNLNRKIPASRGSKRTGETRRSLERLGGGVAP